MQLDELDIPVEHAIKGYRQKYGLGFVRKGAGAHEEHEMESPTERHMDDYNGDMILIERLEGE